jgi:hypothetical protein
MPDLTELQRLAEGATPGWVLELPPAGEWSSRTAYVRAERWGVIAHINLDPSLPHWDGPQRANAAYIAAMNPDTAKKLIAVALAAKYVAYSNGFDAALPEKKEALLAALEELK